MLAIPFWCSWSYIFLSYLLSISMNIWCLILIPLLLHFKLFFGKHIVSTTSLFSEFLRQLFSNFPFNLDVSANYNIAFGSYHYGKDLNLLYVWFWAIKNLRCANIIMINAYIGRGFLEQVFLQIACWFAETIVFPGCKLFE